MPLSQPGIDPSTKKRFKEAMQKDRGTTEGEMAGWHHKLDGHESEQAPGDGDGQGGLASCCPWGYRESDTTE